MIKDEDYILCLGKYEDNKNYIVYSTDSMAIFLYDIDDMNKIYIESSKDERQTIRYLDDNERKQGTKALVWRVPDKKNTYITIDMKGNHFITSLGSIKDNIDSYINIRIVKNDIESTDDLGIWTAPKFVYNKVQMDIYIKKSIVLDVNTFKFHVDYMGEQIRLEKVKVNNTDTDINIPKFVSKVGISSFSKIHCNNINVGIGVENIARSSFISTRALNINLGDKIKKLETQTLRNSTIYEVLRIGKNLESIDDSAIDNCSIDTLIIDSPKLTNLGKLLHGSSIRIIDLSNTGIKVMDKDELNYVTSMDIHGITIYLPNGLLYLGENALPDEQYVGRVVINPKTEIIDHGTRLMNYLKYMMDKGIYDIIVTSEDMRKNMQ